MLSAETVFGCGWSACPSDDGLLFAFRMTNGSCCPMSACLSACPSACLLKYPENDQIELCRLISLSWFQVVVRFDVDLLSMYDFGSLRGSC